MNMQVLGTPLTVRTYDTDAPSTTIDVSIIMPCLNEIETLQGCILEAQETAVLLSEQFHFQSEIIVSDNGSTDGSIELARMMGARVVHVKQRGYGYALRTGAESARGRYIIMADSDGSYDFREAVPMVARLVEGYDLCMGSRFKGKILPGAMPWKNRYIGNPLLSGVLNLMFRSGLSDAHSGIRAFTKTGFQRLHLTSSGMEFASEMVIKATLVNLRRTEIPVTLRPDGRSRPPHLRPWRDGWRHLRYILMLSPTWLFAIPATVLAVLGALIFLLPLLQPSLATIGVGNLAVDEQWMIIAGVMLVVSFQNALFAVATTIYGVRAGYRRLGRAFNFVSKYLKLETLLVLGILLTLIGIVVTADVFHGWSSEGSVSPMRMREMTVAVTLLLIGFQSFFGGFLLAIVAGNDADIYTDVVKQNPTQVTSKKSSWDSFVSELKSSKN